MKKLMVAAALTGALFTAVTAVAKQAQVKSTKETVKTEQTTKTKKVTETNGIVKAKAEKVPSEKAQPNTMKKPGVKAEMAK